MFSKVITVLILAYFSYFNVCAEKLKYETLQSPDKIPEDTRKPELSINENNETLWVTHASVDMDVTANVELNQVQLEQNNLNDSRVNGGEIVSTVVPFQVSMQSKRRGQWRHFCSGSIISTHHVITAAHCVDKIKNLNEVSVVAGTLKWKEGGDRHMLIAKHVHPSFSMDPMIINDIAIVKVNPAFNIHRQTVGTISFSRSSRLGDAVPVRLTGWGSTTPTISQQGLPEHLQMLDYYTITNEVCGRKGFKVTWHELCALAPKGKGACMGDSGGPLVTLNGIPQLVGIVSYGSATCAQGRPDVYTRVSSFLPYINKVITKDLP